MLQSIPLIAIDIYEVIDLMVCKTNRHTEQYLQTDEVSRRSKFQQWKPSTDEEMLTFFGIIIGMGLVQMRKIEILLEQQSAL